MVKKILITGAAGFIGSHLCKKLIDGNKIIALDNLYTGSLDNLKEFQNNENFEFINHDIINQINLEIDEIYNFACPASPVHYQKDPIQTIKTNVLGVMNLLELARKNNAKFLQASTSEVYGNPLIHPQSEIYWGNVNPVGIRSCYDEGKRCAETLVFEYQRKYNLDFKIIRIFNTYGPNMRKDDGRVISNLIIQALRNEDLTLYGNGKQTRSFCYIDDLIEGIVKTMNSKHLGPINLGNNGEFNMLELAEMIINLTNSNSKIIFKELPKDDPEKRKPDISLAKNLLNWEPKINLEAGLKNTIEYFKGVL